MISFQNIEDLKSELTGKYVVVRPGLAELKRFEKLTGIIKTVNMNGRALVEFDGPVDIGWYDIDPGSLDIVDAPRPKVKAEKHAEAAKPAATKAAAPAKAAGKSPLEMARAGAAAPAGDAGKKPSPLDLARGAAKPSAPAAAAGGEKKLSPLELARQGAGKGAETPAVKPAASEASASGKKLSPLDLIRQQGGAKPAAETKAASTASPPVVAQAPTETKAADEPAPAAAKAARPADPPGASKLELARQPLQK